MSKFRLGLGVCLMLLPLLPLAAWCEDLGQRNGRSDQRDADFNPRAAKASSGRIPDSIKIEGVFVPSKRLKIKCEFSGRLENLSIAKGQVVSRENRLFRIEDDQLSEELGLLRAQLQAAETQLEQTKALAETEEPAEEIQEEAVLQPPAEEPAYEEPSYRVPTFSKLASEIRFTSVDAGGVWPGIDPRVIARSNDPPDAGGIWPSYGDGEMVTGYGVLSAWEDFSLTAYLPVPSGGTEFGLIQSASPPQVSRPAVIPSEVEPQEIPEPSEADSRIALYQARMDRIRAEISVLENEFASRDVFSPLDGRIHELAVTEGSEVQVGDFLVEIYQVNPIEFSFQIPKDQVGLLEPGMQVKGRVLDPAGIDFEGEISYIGAELNPDKETVEVRAWTDNADDALKVGLKGAAEIIVPSF